VKVDAIKTINNTIIARKGFFNKDEDIINAGDFDVMLNADKNYLNPETHVYFSVDKAVIYVVVKNNPITDRIEAFERMKQGTYVLSFEGVGGLKYDFVYERVYLGNKEYTLNELKKFLPADDEFFKLINRE